MVQGQDRVLDRLSVHTGMLDQIIRLLAPQEEGSATGLDELVEALMNLTSAVTEQSNEIAALRSALYRRFQLGDNVG